MDALLLRFEAESDQLGQQFPSDAVSSSPKSARNLPRSLRPRTRMPG